MGILRWLGVPLGSIVGCGLRVAEEGGGDLVRDRLLLSSSTSQTAAPGSERVGTGCVWAYGLGLLIACVFPGC